MRKISVEEAKNLTPHSGGRTTLVSVLVSELQTGEGLEITRADWKGKKPPYAVINRVAQKTGRTFAKWRMADGSGWRVKRLT